MISKESTWVCPYCNHAASITNQNYFKSLVSFYNGNKDGNLGIRMEAVTCPNRACREYEIRASLIKGEGGQIVGSSPTYDSEPMMQWRLRPQSSARPLPNYIPAPLIADYTEACLIRDLSPKASATLSRRCLQGMIRNFWGVKKNTLHEEINGIQDKVDPAVWAAIDAVRKIGNIGAHMEKDINLVIDVDPGEAQTLIQLIEMLFKEWYIARKDRADLSASIVAIAEAKKSQKAPADRA